MPDKQDLEVCRWGRNPHTDQCNPDPNEWLSRQYDEDSGIPETATGLSLLDAISGREEDAGIPYTARVTPEQRGLLDALKRPTGILSEADFLATYGGDGPTGKYPSTANARRAVESAAAVETAKSGAKKAEDKASKERDKVDKKDKEGGGASLSDVRRMQEANRKAEEAKAKVRDAAILNTENQKRAAAQAKVAKDVEYRKKAQAQFHIDEANKAFQREMDKANRRRLELQGPSAIKSIYAPGGLLY